MFYFTYPSVSCQLGIRKGVCRYLETVACVQIYFWGRETYLRGEEPTSLSPQGVSVCYELFCLPAMLKSSSVKHKTWTIIWKTSVEKKKFCVEIISEGNSTMYINQPLCLHPSIFEITLFCLAFFSSLSLVLCIVRWNIS